MKKIIFIFSLMTLISFTSMGKSNINLINDYPAKVGNNLINVVVEIPAGTSEKWEVAKPNGQLALNYKKNKPRIIKYLPYPFNYGMIPNTLGGDGDSLDAIVIGNSIKRGEVVQVKVIGVLRLLDKGQQDDKIITISQNSPLYFIENISQLNKKFPGVTQIIQTWFKNYKGNKKIKIQRFSGKKKADSIIDLSIQQALN
jgi:inorganic pyrophosphatase